MSMSPGPARHLQRGGVTCPRGVVDIGFGGDRTIEWLSAGDPSVRWQVMRDLLGRPEDQVVERACGQKQRPSPFATARLLLVLRRFDDLCDEVATVGVTALTSSKGGAGTARPPKPQRRERSTR